MKANVCVGPSKDVFQEEGEISRRGWGAKHTRMVHYERKSKEKSTIFSQKSFKHTILAGQWQSIVSLAHLPLFSGRV
jgi:hypothetical protein